METFFWLLGEFASLKSKHDSGETEANQQNLLNVIANAVKQSFLPCHCEPKARQSFQLHNNGLPRRCAPRNDDGVASNGLPRRYAPRNDDGVASNGLPRRCAPRNDDVVACNRLPRRCAPRNDDVVANNGLPRRYAPRNDGNTCGRSMIEMLGVLAIIGVLSVGGIAGYSKAMEQWKVNKAISDYTYLIQGLLEHLPQLKYLSSDNTQVRLTNYIKAANLTPATWRLTDFEIKDAYGNTTYIFSQYDNLVINLYLGGITTSDKGENVTSSFSDKLCVALFQNLGQPLHKALTLVRTSKWGNGNKVMRFYGDDYCGGNKKCLKDTTFAEMKEACGICDNTNSWCNFTLEF